MKGENFLVRAIPNVHSFRNIVLNIFTVLIEDMIIPDLLLNSLSQGIQKFTKTKEVNSKFVMVLMILHDFSNINGTFVAEPLCKNHRIRDRTTNSKR